MKPGETFEIQCYEYLKSKYGNKFYHEGGMDSTKSDIAFVKNNQIVFYIEVKDSKAQSGQFVLLPDCEREQFNFSPQNKSIPNEMTDIIINHMNKNFARFNNSGTSGVNIDIKPEVFSSWVISYYKCKNVKYIISYKNGYVIFPIEKFDKYFCITARYRIKKSGSSSPAKKDISILQKLIKEKYSSADFLLENNKLFTRISENITNNKFTLGSYSYYFSEKEPGLYEIRRLSNTYNMNVIFSIQLQSSQNANDLQEFEDDLMD